MTVAATIPILDPNAIVFARGSIWVLTEEEGNRPQDPVLRVDPASNEIVAGIRSGNRNIAGGGWQIAEDPTGLWIATPDGTDPPGGFNPGPVPQDIHTVYRDGRPTRADLYKESTTGGLVLIDPEKNTVQRRMIFLDWRPTSVALTPAGLWIVAGDGDGDILALLDTKTGAFRSVRPFEHATLHTGFGSLWASGGKGVRRLDPMTGEVVITVDTGGVRELTIGPDAVWAAAGEKVIRIDPVTNRIVARIAVEDVWGVAANDQTVLATGFRSHRLYRIDPARNVVTDHLDLGAPHPDAAMPVTTSVLLAAGSAWVLNGELLRIQF